MNKDDHYPPTKAAAAGYAPPPAPKRETTGSESAAGGGIFGRSRYKLWVLAAILLLAFWSMFTGTVTLKWSAGNLNRLSGDLLDGAPLHDDLDILEVEEREKVVRHMWEAYIHSSSSNRLPRFWLDAFQAAYDSLASDVQPVRDAAVSEIAKLSLSSTFFSTASAADAASDTQLPVRSLKARRARKLSRYSE